MQTPLLKLRKRRNLTQTEVAHAVNVDVSHICRVERNEHGASPELAEALVNYFGGGIDEIQILYPERFLDNSP